ncbi:efflux RND transporter permease subunit, partial [Escherichia coli]|uniref:efflux RND transporter permease subunit n=1 Tax=Escherichia coli TaxID=562 RepID=UPI0013AFA0F1
QALSLYAVSILVVFLCLAALYESWSVPFSVILVIPLGLLGAAQTRLRPIIMTSLAFIAGVMPLAIATGAGANSRIAIGTGI